MVVGEKASHDPVGVPLSSIAWAWTSNVAVRASSPPVPELNANSPRGAPVSTSMRSTVVPGGLAANGPIQVEPAPASGSSTSARSVAVMKRSSAIARSTRSPGATTAQSMSG